MYIVVCYVDCLFIVDLGSDNFSSLSLHAFYLYIVVCYVDCLFIVDLGSDNFSS